MPLLGNTSQEFENKIYTLEFKVNLEQISFEGLTNYAVTVSCFDKDTGITERISSVLDMHLHENKNDLTIEGGPPVFFTVGSETMDLSSMELDQSIVDAVNSGLSWLKGESSEKLIKNRRSVPRTLLEDRMAMNLLMSSISTIIAGSIDCHKRVIKEKRHLFTEKNDYIDAMYEALRADLDELTVVAVNRGVKHFVNTE